MNAHKFLIGSTLILVLALLGGSLYYPHALVMSFAETSTAFNVLRLITALLLVVLLVTNPPRSKKLRTVIGVMAVGLGMVAVQLLLSYQINLLDALVFMEIAIIFAVEALESRKVIPVSQKHTPAKKIPVYST